MRLTVCLFTLVLLAGCQSTGKFARDSAMSFGAPISQADCELLAKPRMSATLSSPETARFRWGTCMGDTLPKIKSLGLPKQSGFAMAFEVDFEGPEGQRSGFRSYEILIKDGAIIRLLKADPTTGQWSRV